MRKTKNCEKKLNQYQENLIISNMGLAYSRAIIMNNKYSGYNLSLDIDDFNSYALEGLCNAALKYDEARNVKFSTFAVSYIDNYIKRNVYIENPTIKMPIYSPDKEKMKYYRYIALKNGLVTSNTLGCVDSDGKSVDLDSLYYCGEDEPSFQIIEDSLYIESIKKQLSEEDCEFLSYIIEGKLNLVEISNKLNIHLNTACRRKKKLARKIKEYMSNDF